MSFWQKGEKPPKDRGNALPCTSVDTVEDAESMLVMFGKLGLDGIYRYSMPSTTSEGDFDISGMTALRALEAAGERFEEWYRDRQKMKEVEGFNLSRM